MKSFNRARLAVALAVLVCGRDGQHHRLAADRRRDGEERDRVSRQPDRRTAREGGGSAQLTGSHALELHPDQHVSAAGSPDQGDDRAAAQARARAAQERPESARLHHHHRDHERARGHPARHRGGGARRETRRQHPRSRALFLHGVRHAGGQGRVGLAGRRASRVAALHRRRRHRSRRRPLVLGHQPGRSARGSEEGPARARPRTGRRPRADDGARRRAEEDGAHRRSRPDRHPDEDRGRSSTRCRRSGSRRVP